MSHNTPPQIASWILTRLLDRDAREFGLGDLQEEFDVRARGNPASARRWYRRQMARAIATRLTPRRRQPAFLPSAVAHLARVGAGTVQDIRYAARSLRSSRAFTAMAVLTLALGIGATTAIYTILDTVLLRPLPFQDPDRLVILRNGFVDGRPGEWLLSFPDYLDYQAGAEGFEHLAAWLIHTPGLSSDDGAPPVRIRSLDVTWDLLPALGIRTVLGRAFLPQDDRAGAGQPTALLSHSLWRDRFGSDPSVLGREIRLDGRPYTVIGVLPPGFTGAIGGSVLPATAPDVWLPLRNSFSADGIELRGLSNVSVIGRLRPGVSLEQARFELASIAAAIARQFPEGRDGEGPVLQSAGDAAARPVRGVLLILFGAVSLLLLIACTNVASLILGRAAARGREFAIRAALGAGRGRLIRQALAESLLLALLGGAAGWLIAHLTVQAMSQLDFLSIPRLATASVDTRILGFLVAVSLLTAGVVGVVPALRVSRPQLRTAIKSGDRATAGGSESLTRQSLVVAQIALATLLLVGAGLLIRSLRHALEIDPGFVPQSVLTARLQLPLRFVDPEWRTSVDLFERLLARIERLPGVTSASAAYMLPTDPGWSNSFQIEGPPPSTARERKPQAIFRPVTPGYFRTAGVRLHRGRTFTARDSVDAPRVVIVNESFVRTYFDDREEPLGRSLVYGNWWAGGPPEYEIVGIVEDVHFSGRTEETPPATYFPHAQQPVREMYLLVRAEGDPWDLVDSIRAATSAVDPTLPVDTVATLEELLAETESSRRSIALAIALFAATALFLSAIGVYGVMAFLVLQRTREFGIRLALGASHADIRAMVLGRGLTLAAIGLLIGLGAAIPVSRVLSGLLYEIRPTDVPTFTAVVLFLGAVGCIATWIPARRATRIDPMVSLRSE